MGSSAVEHWTENPCAVGSSPTPGKRTIKLFLIWLASPPPLFFSLKNWPIARKPLPWTEVESNYQPHPYQGYALPIELSVRLLAKARSHKGNALVCKTNYKGSNPFLAFARRRTDSFCGGIGRRVWLKIKKLKVQVLPKA